MCTPGCTAIDVSDGVEDNHVRAEVRGVDATPGVGVLHVRVLAMIVHTPRPGGCARINNKKQMDT